MVNFIIKESAGSSKRGNKKNLKALSRHTVMQHLVIITIPKFCERILIRQLVLRAYCFFFFFLLSKWHTNLRAERFMSLNSESNARQKARVRN